MKLAAVTFTPQGFKIVDELKKQMEIQHFCKENTNNFNIKSLGEKLMKDFEGIIFVGASGIAVRTIAPYITTKDKDPAVLVIDNESKFVISLLSGHLGGANELTLTISGILKAQPVITTATDTLGIEAPDIIAVNNNCKIENLTKAKEIAALLVKGEKVAFLSDFPLEHFPKGYVDFKEKESCSGLVYMTNKKHNSIIGELPENIKRLKLIKKNIVLGIGCRKNFDANKMADFVEKELENHNIDSSAVGLITTVEIKKDEEAILKLADKYKCPIKIWTIDEIREVQHKFQGSDFVEKTLGIRAVCEPSVDLCGAKILVEKIAQEGMTLCIGEGE